MKTAFECLPCTSRELAAIRGCTMHQANGLLYGLMVAGLARRAGTKVGANGYPCILWEKGREREGNLPHSNPMVPVRSPSQWDACYRELVRLYVQRSRQAVLERATRFMVT